MRVVGSTRVSVGVVGSVRVVQAVGPSEGSLLRGVYGSMGVAGLVGAVGGRRTADGVSWVIGAVGVVGGQ